MNGVLPILKAMADRNRLRVLQMLLHRDGCCACELQAVLGVGQSTTSWHLKTLEEVGIIRSTRDGKWVNYHLNIAAGTAVSDLFGAVCRQITLDPQIQDDLRKLQDVDRRLLHAARQEVLPSINVCDCAPS